MVRFGVHLFGLFVGFLAAFLASAGTAADRLAGPYPAAVERIVDGDTLSVRVTIWLQHDIRVSVRLRGIDAPELRGRCDAEKLRAEAATKALARLVVDQPVTLTAIEGDKYFGRVVADVATSEGEDIAAAASRRRLRPRLCGRDAGLVVRDRRARRRRRDRAGRITQRAPLSAISRIFADSPA